MLRVLGAGFGRTGTNSLRRALEMLGFGPCHHMYEVGDDPVQVSFWEEVAHGRTRDWARGFAGYRSQVDWPGACYWRELAEACPDAPVILTVRDPDAWHASVMKTIWPTLAARGRRETPLKNRLSELNWLTINERIFDGRLNDRSHATDIFRHHAEEVSSTIPPDRLLIFDVREGWAPLCTRLGAPVPDAPFPATNSTAEFRALADLGPGPA